MYIICVKCIHRKVEIYEVICKNIKNIKSEFKIFKVIYKNINVGLSSISFLNTRINLYYYGNQITLF